jgi:hypothetical protein
VSQPGLSSSSQCSWGFEVQFEEEAGPDLETGGRWEVGAEDWTACAYVRICGGDLDGTPGSWSWLVLSTRAPIPAVACSPPPLSFF